VKLSALKYHPVNEQLYEDDDCEDLIDSIEREGLKVPPLITQDNIVISGHRRVKALRILNIEEILCNVKEYETQDEELIDLITYNLYRLKTNEQKIREGIMLERLYKEDQGSYGKPIRDVIGEKMGISGRSYADGKEVVQKIDEFKTADMDKYKSVKSELNKSIRAGKKAIEEPSIEPQLEDNRHAYWKEFLKVIEQLEKSHAKLSKQRNHTTPHALGHMIGNLIDFADRVKTWAPENMVNCSVCGGDGRDGDKSFCDHCIDGQVGVYKESKY